MVDLVPTLMAGKMETVRINLLVASEAEGGGVVVVGGLVTVTTVVI